jgi:hypothetical protein
LRVRRITNDNLFAFPSGYDQHAADLLPLSPTRPARVPPRTQGTSNHPLQARSSAPELHVQQSVSRRLQRPPQPRFGP